MKDKTIVLEVDPKRVANMLKRIVNNNCEDGFVWYKDVGSDMPNMFDMSEAIRILENAETETITIEDE